MEFIVHVQSPLEGIPVAQLSAFDSVDSAKDTKDKVQFIHLILLNESVIHCYGCCHLVMVSVCSSDLIHLPLHHFNNSYKRKKQ